MYTFISNHPKLSPKQHVPASNLINETMLRSISGHHCNTSKIASLCFKFYCEQISCWKVPSWRCFAGEVHVSFLLPVLYYQSKPKQRHVCNLIISEGIQVYLLLHQLCYEYTSHVVRSFVLLFFLSPSLSLPPFLLLSWLPFLSCFLPSVEVRYLHLCDDDCGSNSNRHCGYRHHCCAHVFQPAEFGQFYSCSQHLSPDGRIWNADDVALSMIRGTCKISCDDNLPTCNSP